MWKTDLQMHINKQWHAHWKALFKKELHLCRSHKCKQYHKESHLTQRLLRQNETWYWSKLLMTRVQILPALVGSNHHSAIFTTTHWANIKISYLPCLQKHEVYYTYLVEDRAEFHANEGNVQKILPYPSDFLHD